MVMLLEKYYLAVAKLSKSQLFSEHTFHDIRSYLTMLCKAETAVPRFEGSSASSTINKFKADEGRSLNVSNILDLYSGGGWKLLVNFSFFQKSSDGDPQSINIFWSCSI